MTVERFLRLAAIIVFAWGAATALRTDGPLDLSAMFSFLFVGLILVVASFV